MQSLNLGPNVTIPYELIKVNQALGDVKYCADPSDAKAVDNFVNEYENLTEENRRAYDTLIGGRSQVTGGRRLYHLMRSYLTRRSKADLAPLIRGDELSTGGGRRHRSNKRRRSKRRKFKKGKKSKRKSKRNNSKKR